MASDYGRNFGFRRSNETLRTSEGEFKTPIGTALLMGTAVEINPASTGYLKASATNATIIPGYAGLLVQEEAHLPSIYDAQVADSFSLGVAKPGRLSVVTNGAGTKVWFKNTAVQTRVDGRSIAAVTIATLTGVSVGDQLGWNGTTWAKVTGALTNAWMIVTKVTGTTYCEAVLLK